MQLLSCKQDYAPMTLGIFKYGHIIFKHKLVIIVIIHNIFSKQDLFILQSITSLFVI